jgi:hypothetical protein
MGMGIGIGRFFPESEWGRTMEEQQQLWLAMLATIRLRMVLAPVYPSLIPGHPATLGPLAVT